MVDNRTDNEKTWEQDYIDNIKYLELVAAERESAYATYESNLSSDTSTYDNSGGITTSGGGGSVETYLNMDIRGSTSLTAAQINAYIDSKASQNSSLRGRGQDFIDAQNESGLNAEYLLSHAIEETGWGTSNIQKDKNNFFGIGAFDNSAYESAYSFDSVKAGIVGGAKWIAEHYANKGQNTLNLMRNNGGKHQYATNPLWDDNIATLWSNLPVGKVQVNLSNSNANLGTIQIASISGGRILLPTTDRSTNQKEMYGLINKIGVEQLTSLDSKYFSFPNGQQSNLFFPHFVNIMYILHQTLAPLLGVDKIIATSGLRTKIIDVEKKTSMKLSPHMCANSIDLSANLNNRLLIADTAYGLGFRGIGVGKRHVHVDGFAEGHWAEVYDDETKIYYGPGNFK
jgi:beta-N-acetylglucosaminidase